MNKRTAPGEVLTQIILEVFRLNGNLLDAGNRLTKPLGLTSARWQVMGSIELEGQALTVAQIARRMGLARQGVQRIVNQLVTMGMLALQDNRDHKRAPLVSISNKGMQAMQQIGAAQIEWVNELADGLSTDPLLQALKTLQTLRMRTETDKEN